VQSSLPFQLSIKLQRDTRLSLVFRGSSESQKYRRPRAAILQAVRLIGAGTFKAIAGVSGKLTSRYPS
jgi:hypothetical protein